MTDLSTTVVATRKSGRGDGMSLLSFIWQHLLLVMEERALQKDTAVAKPLEVLLTDGTAWRLQSRSGIEWHLKKPDGREKVVTSAQVASLPTKWDYKS